MEIVGGGSVSCTWCLSLDAGDANEPLQRNLGKFSGQIYLGSAGLATVDNCNSLVCGGFNDCTFKETPLVHTASTATSVKEPWKISWSNLLGNKTLNLSDGQPWCEFDPSFSTF